MSCKRRMRAHRPLRSRAARPVAANEAISPRNQNPLSAQFHAAELTGAADKLEAKTQAARVRSSGVMDCLGDVEPACLPLRRPAPSTAQNLQRHRNHFGVQHPGANVGLKCTGSHLKKLSAAQYGLNERSTTLGNTFSTGAAKVRMQHGQVKPGRVGHRLVKRRHHDDAGNAPLLQTLGELE